MKSKSCREYVPANWSILTPPAATGAIAVIELSAPSGAELDDAIRQIGLVAVPTGLYRVRDLLGVDTGVVARWTDTCLHLMPHGGIGIVREVTRRLTELGVTQGAETLYPEATSALESRMLTALAHAASPLAIDLLLDQPRRWKLRSDSSPSLDRILSRLIDPPLVAAIGPPNVGKSTLANVLAGRAVAIVADEPGTTRDHIGVMLDLGGLVVRYLDTPGIRTTTDAIERESQALALQAAAGADLILLMGDSASAPPSATGLPETALRVALRADLGTPSWPHDLAVSAHTGIGIAALTGAIREALVPAAAMNDPRPWQF